MFKPCLNKGNAVKIPIIIAAYSINLYSNNKISHTFVKGGKYQILIYSGGGTTPVVKINDDVVAPVKIEPATNNYYAAIINVAIGDVLDVENTAGILNYGMQLYIFENADISSFSVIGERGNDGTSFAINGPGAIFLEVYQFSYYGIRNAFHYYEMVGYEGLQSIITPNDSSYYYGGTFVVKIYG